MRARINNEGVLEFERNGKFIMQRCICEEVYKHGRYQTSMCHYSCPLMGEPCPETIGINMKNYTVYILECCKFTIKSTTPFYEEVKTHEIALPKNS